MPPYRQFNRYTHAILVQIAQNVVCDRLTPPRNEPVWAILMTQDRVGKETFRQTGVSHDARRPPPATITALTLAREEIV
jgi:hypothetical protein